MNAFAHGLSSYYLSVSCELNPDVRTYEFNLNIDTIIHLSPRILIFKVSIFHGRADGLEAHD
jgi:hypothetical protein